MLIISPPVMQNTPATQMPYHTEFCELTQVADTITSFLGAGTVLTGDGLAIKWEMPSDLTGAPRETRAHRETPPEATITGERGLRLRLLARKYGRSSFTREDEARLEILNERFRRVMQRVSEDDVVALESTAQQLEDSRELRKRIEEKYGL
jgi:hypothetical protein